jgi:hypothetical protein
MNPIQGDPPAYPERHPASFAEVKLLLDGGFTTAAKLDTCAVSTSGRNCSDYVFVSPDLKETASAWWRRPSVTTACSSPTSSTADPLSYPGRVVGGAARAELLG